MLLLAKSYPQHNIYRYQYLEYLLDDTVLRCTMCMLFRQGQFDASLQDRQCMKADFFVPDIFPVHISHILI